VILPLRLQNEAAVYPCFVTPLVFLVLNGRKKGNKKHRGKRQKYPSLISFHQPSLPEHLPGSTPLPIALHGTHLGFVAAPFLPLPVTLPLRTPVLLPLRAILLFLLRGIQVRKPRDREGVPCAAGRAGSPCARGRDGGASRARGDREGRQALRARQ